MCAIRGEKLFLSITEARGQFGVYTYSITKLLEHTCLSTKRRRRSSPAGFSLASSCDMSVTMGVTAYRSQGLCYNVYLCFDTPLTSRGVQLDPKDDVTARNNVASLFSSTTSSPRSRWYQSVITIQCQLVLVTTKIQ